jgi:hypothetical protein
MKPEAPSTPDSISWEELPAIPSLWVPESVAARMNQEPEGHVQRFPEVAAKAIPKAQEKPVAEAPAPAPSPPPQVAPPSTAEAPAAAEIRAVAPQPERAEKPASAAEAGRPVSPQPVKAPTEVSKAPTPPEAPAPQVAAKTPEAEQPAAPAISEALAAPAPPKPPTTQPVPVPEAASPPAAPAPPPAASAPAARAVPGPSDFPEVSQSTDRDSIATAALSALGRRFERGAIFAARPDAVAAWGVTGNVDVERFRSIEIPWNEPSIFLNVRYSRTFYLGPLPPLPRHASFARALGGWPEECVVYPVLLRDRPVAFLYAEFSQDRGATPMDLAYLRELAAASSIAFAAAIRLRKREL